MRTSGVDVDERECQRSENAEDGAIMHRRIATSRERVITVFGARLRPCLLLEPGTGCACLARHAESLGRALIVPTRSVR